MALLAELPVPAGTLRVRRAEARDLRAILGLIAAGDAGGAAPPPAPDDALASQERAFAILDADRDAHLLVAGELGGRLVATLHLTMLPDLARGLVLRGQLESVHVAAELRGGGVGGALVRWAIDEAARRGAGLVQLTSNKRRPDAHRFYERLGFTRSHEGFKLLLDEGLGRDAASAPPPG